jgi:hypothetical protein
LRNPRAPSCRALDPSSLSENPLAMTAFGWWGWMARMPSQVCLPLMPGSISISSTTRFIRRFSSWAVASGPLLGLAVDHQDCFPVSLPGVYANTCLLPDPCRLDTGAFDQSAIANQNDIFKARCLSCLEKDPVAFGLKQGEKKQSGLGLKHRGEHRPHRRFAPAHGSGQYDLPAQFPESRFKPVGQLPGVDVSVDDGSGFVRTPGASKA